MDIKQINSAIITGEFTNEQLTSIIDAVRFARERLTVKAKCQFAVGSKVQFTSTKRNQVIVGSIRKVAQKYATVETTQGMWKVPMNMLTAA